MDSSTINLKVGVISETSSLYCVSDMQASAKDDSVESESTFSHKDGYHEGYEGFFLYCDG